MTDKEVQEAVARADAEYDMLKDRVHEQYDEIEKLKEDVDYYKTSRDELITSNTKLREEKLRLNNIRKNTIDFCNRYLSLNLDEFNADKLLKKIIELQGDDKSE